MNSKEIDHRLHTNNTERKKINAFWVQLLPGRPEGRTVYRRSGIPEVH